MKVGSGGGKRSESDKEKTKMRERQRRAITTNIFHGLRKHGGYRLSPRADINEVLRELAKEAGWVIESDGTTYRSKFWDSKVSNRCPQCGALQTTTNLTPTSGAVIGGGGGGECSTTALGDPLSSIDVMSGSLLCFPESFNGRCRQHFPVPVYTYQELTGEAQSGDGEGGRNSSDGSLVECSAIAMMTCQQQGEVLRFEAVSRSNQRTMEGSSLHHA